MIKLSQIKEALEDSDMNSTCYFNVETSEILWQRSNNEEYSTYREDELNNNIIKMFDFFTKNDYDIMQEFIATIDDISLRNKLYNATIGKGAFSNFRNIVDSKNITNDWYNFRDKEYKKISINWCYDNNIDYDEDC